MRALTCTAVLLALARCSIEGNATTLAGFPELEIVRAPQWSEVGVTSDVRRAIARFLVEGGTVGRSSPPPHGARRCRPERDAAC